MKKLFTLLSFLTFATAMLAQVPRNYVVVEIATGTWCYYCPGSAMGADDLHDNGDPVAIVENHNGDPFTTADSDGRNTYYQVTGYPTANFDGEYDDYVGGSNTSSMYSNYKPIVDARILISSTHAMKIYGDNDGDDYDVTIRFQKQGTYDTDNLKVRLVLTESDIPYDWQGMDEVNFVNRLMAPDKDGIDVTDLNDFEVHDVDFSFEFDNTWDKTQSELVAFIQDDDTKVILQSVKVMINDLEPTPPMIAASFTSDELGVCTSGNIEYTPLATGSNLSYVWTFEGGTPATSTDASPTVYYDVVGEFNTGLIVTDGYFSDTNLVVDYMPVVNPVEQPDMPDGEEEICSGFVYDYEVPELAFAWEYEWEVSPTQAGTLTWNMNSADFEPASDWAGEYTIKVRAGNICGFSDWSDEFTGTLYTSPSDFDFDGGGTYCDGDEGLELTLNGSESGVNYELFLDGESTGEIIAGTGSALSFGMHSEEGYYTVDATTDNCEVQMTGQQQIYITYPPLAPSMPEGPAAACNTDVSEYETAGDVEADSFIWSLTPEEAGTIEGNELTAIVTWNDDFTGEASITVSGVNTCGEGSPSEEFTVDVDAAPAPYVDGQSLVCDNHTEMYEAVENDGSTYTWEVTGGTITEGQGTYMITVEWGDAGSGTVVVTEETANGCPGTSTSFPVQIDDCTGIGDDVADALSIHPNPAREFVSVKSASQLQTVAVYTLTGEMIIHEDVNGLEYRLNTSDFKAGLYLIRISSENGVVSKRLIIE